MAPFSRRDIDIALACGGPKIVPWIRDAVDVSLAELHAHGVLARSGVPVASLALGSAYPLQQLPSALSPEAAALVRQALSYTAVATVRDDLAQRLLRGIDYEAELIPCSAFIAGLRFQRAMSGDAGRFVVVNYLPKGANDDWGQGIDTAVWRETVRELVARLSKRHVVKLLCHDVNEQRIARELALDAEIVFPRSFEEYANAISGAKAGVVNRVHAAIPLASVGVPTIGVGTDTRLGALEAIGLTTHYVKEVTADLLESEIEDLCARADEERERLLVERERATKAYVRLIRSLVSRVAPV